MQIPMNDENSTEVPLNAKPALPAYQARVVQEKQELDDKIEKLDNFLLSELFQKLPDAEQERLDRQLSIMKDYSAVLGERIAAFPAPSLTIVP